ncbi:hypothetical protein TVAG_416630 [Trichomonas vaginalis G3]|uniref:Uncharacterized protein n=1 Tax=Trichomonas vaginalis (strain ATCC PRA-98 / G3) TaxID=412133 RepID=A2EQQ5_TRIV3|nr:Ankyrin repeat family [Trichomonas vaginalis G3]EAY05020.1 hypothetical protein TVAG_416630 [Trichomonas vaginalis G3]KAI5502938.1 Ankyrin repeat family [Trichomonas vaginalis G3]|eukprot:XP_001317243.1 hypothetical protein [Trichomonas vaginalis G3]
MTSSFPYASQVYFDLVKLGELDKIKEIKDMDFIVTAVLPKYKLNLYQYATLLGKLDIIKYFDSINKDVFYSLDEQGNNPLHLSIISQSENSREVFDYFASRQDIIKSSNFANQTVLDLCIQYNKIKMMFDIIQNYDDARELVSNLNNQKLKVSNLVEFTLDLLQSRTDDSEVKKLHEENQKLQAQIENLNNGNQIIEELRDLKEIIAEKDSEISLLKNLLYHSFNVEKPFEKVNVNVPEDKIKQIEQSAVKFSAPLWNMLSKFLRYFCDENTCNKILEKQNFAKYSVNLFELSLTLGYFSARLFFYVDKNLK